MIEHECKQEGRLDVMGEDLASVKTILGYKDKFDGEFKEYLQLYFVRLNKMEEACISLSASISSIKWLLALIFPLLIVILAEVILKK